MALPRKNNAGLLNAGIFVVILFYGLALYFVPLHSKAFYFDDNGSIVDNQAIKTIDLPRIFNAFNTRSLVGLSFALNYSWCGLHPVGYRLINLLIHCLNAFLVYLLIRSTLGVLRKTNNLEWPAFFGAMLFLCHPIQTEPVNFITQRFVLMGSFFYLLTLYLYIQYRCLSQKEYLFASMASAMAAMFCKEFVITLPFMLALYEFYFLGSMNAAAGKRSRRLIPFFIIVLIVPILLLRTPPDAIGVANIADSSSIQEGDITAKGVDRIDITRAWGAVSRKQYFLTELNVVRTYIRLLVLPVNQNFDYDYPFSRGLDIKTALSGLFLFCLLAVAALTYRSNRLISFGILWFFIALSVESSFIPIGHVIAEYRVYLASIGFVFLVMNLIYMRQMDVKKLNMIAAMIIIGFSFLTYQRNKIWKDEVTLWGDSVQKSPHKSRPYYNRGFAYFHQGKYNEAMPDFNEAIKISPDYVVVYINRGIIYYEESKFTQALSDYDKAIQINPNIAEIYYNRGNVYAKQNDLNRALSDYDKAIELRPAYVEAYINRGSIYLMQGNLTQALSNYNKAIEIYPSAVFSTDAYIWLYGIKSAHIGDVFKSHYTSYAEVYYDRGLIYDKQGHLIQAISDYSKAILLNPAYADAYNNRGNIYSRQGQYPQAIADSTKAILLNPNIAGYYYNQAIDHYGLAEYGNAWGDVHKAEALGAVIDPKFINVLSQASGKTK